MKHFFISYNRADRVWAEWIAWQLEAEGYEVILQAWDFRPGGNFVLDMQRGTEEAERTIAVLSDDYLKSEYTKPEWAAAFAQDPTGKESKLLPVLVRECELKGLLAQIVYIDLLKLDEATARQVLVDGAQYGRAKPKVKPTYPNASSRAMGNEPHFPGAMPAIWNIPLLHNPHFTGRKDELMQLRDSLTAGEMGVFVQVRAIHGIGGVGKTRLVIEYAYRHGTDYRIVWWLRSEDSEKLMKDYLSLAVKLDLSEEVEAEPIRAFNAVKEWLRQHRGWLLIFDNAEDAESIENYIPRGHFGHIIITSRNPHWTGIAESILVKVWSTEKAVMFLLERTGSKDEVMAKTLVEKLGCLPLALEEASSFIQKSGRTIPYYLEHFDKRQRDLMKRGELSTEYPVKVSTAWITSFRNVERDNPPAAELLRLCAFFAPNDIPLNMISDWADELPEPLAGTVKDLFSFDEALIALKRYSLVEVEGERLSMNQLIQRAIRNLMSDEELKQWTRIAVQIVNASFPNNWEDIQVRQLCESLVPHASAVLSYAEDIEFTSNETARLFNEMDLYQKARAECE